MRHIDYGLGVLAASGDWQYLDRIPFDLSTITPAAKDAGACGVRGKERFYEIGLLADSRKRKSFSWRGFLVNYTQQHLNETIEIIKRIDIASIEAVADLLADVKNGPARVLPWRRR